LLKTVSGRWPLKISQVTGSARSIKSREPTLSIFSLRSPSTPAFRTGGIEGLRDRVVSAGGALVVEPSNDGFRLVATLPGGRG